MRPDHCHWSDKSSQHNPRWSGCGSTGTQAEAISCQALRSALTSDHSQSHPKSSPGRMALLCQLREDYVPTLHSRQVFDRSAGCPERRPQPRQSSANQSRPTTATAQDKCRASATQSFSLRRRRWSRCHSSLMRRSMATHDSLDASSFRPDCGPHTVSVSDNRRPQLSANDLPLV